MKSTSLIWFFSAFILNLQNLPANASQESIKIILNNWSSQLVVSRIIGDIYQQMGHVVEYIQLPTDGQWYMLRHNRVHVQVEVWEGTMADKYHQMLDANWLIDAGSYQVTTREEWWYPEYVEAHCPGLPDWQALKSCASSFARRGSKGYGVYFGGPWEKPDKARVRALGLKFKIINTHTSEQLWVELNKAVDSLTPILLFNWTPNWVGSVHKGKFVEFPEHTAACESEPEWGVNPDFLYDCGNPKSGWLKKVVATEFPEKWPCAYQVLKNMDFSNAQLEEISALVDVQLMSHQDAATFWLQQNAELWRSWIPEQC